MDRECPVLCVQVPRRAGLENTGEHRSHFPLPSSHRARGSSFLIVLCTLYLAFYTDIPILLPQLKREPPKVRVCLGLMCPITELTQGACLAETWPIHM